jgi:ABC-type multidrug transport system fused ATPase/permease subunit
LILDEPTSNLNPESEAEIIGTLDQITVGRTVFLITHRLSLAVGADHIIVLDKGKVAEQGTHTDLMAANGFYAHLVETFGSGSSEA